MSSDLNKLSKQKTKLRIMMIPGRPCTVLRHRLDSNSVSNGSEHILSRRIVKMIVSEGVGCTARGHGARRKEANVVV